MSQRLCRLSLVDTDHAILVYGLWMAGIRAHGERQCQTRYYSFHRVSLVNRVVPKLSNINIVLLNRLLTFQKVKVRRKTHFWRQKTHFLGQNRHLSTFFYISGQIRLENFGAFPANTRYSATPYNNMVYYRNGVWFTSPSVSSWTLMTLFAESSDTSTKCSWRSNLR